MPRPRTLQRIALVLCLTLSVVGAVVAAGLPAPQFLPGQPMIVGQQVLMMWTPVPGASGYIIYRDNERQERVASNQFLAPLPATSGQYRYQVSAVDAQGVEGARSEPGVVRVRALTAPQRLTVQPNPGVGALSVLWDRVEGAVIYNVYRGREGEEPKLVASVQQETYQDGTVEAGVRYTYRVAAKDVSGTEGPPSGTATAALERKEAAPAEKTVFRASPTTEVLSVAALAGNPIEQVSDLRIGPNGNLWVVTPKTRQIHVLSPAGVELTVLGPYSFAQTGYSLLPQKLDFGPQGNLYVSDAINGVLACIDPAGTFLWARGIIAPPPHLADVWKDLPGHLKSLPPTPSSVLCLDQEIWVTDQRFQLLYRFDYQGEFLGYQTTYTLKGGKTARLSNVGEVLRAAPGRLLLTFPLAHRALVVDEQFRAVAEIGATARGYLGGFVGVHGAQPLPQGRVLLTDPAVGSLQVFDVETGAYLYHLSGPEPRPDPGYSQRADLPLRKPNLAVQDREGRFWVFDAATKRIVSLKPSGPVTPELLQ